MHFCSCLLLWEIWWRRGGFFRCSLLSAIAEGKKPFFLGYFFVKGKCGPVKKPSLQIFHVATRHTGHFQPYFPFLSFPYPTRCPKILYMLRQSKNCTSKVYILHLKRWISMDTWLGFEGRQHWTFGWAIHIPFPHPNLYSGLLLPPPPLPSSFPSTEFKQEEEGMWG